jgi:prepilin-type N-terminal cleavage/methylation domain-containing protein
VKKIKHPSPNRQKGLSLLEVSIAMAISGLFVVAYMESSVKDLQQMQVSAEASWIIDAVKNIQQGFNTEKSFASLKTPYLVSVNSIPRNYITGAGSETTVNNGSGGKLYVDGLTLGGDSAMAMTYTGLSGDNCSSFITEIESIARQKSTPLYALIGSKTNVTSVPSVNWDSGNRWVVASGTDVALKKSPDTQLDVSTTAKFCRQSTSIKSITLIRMWAL